MSETSARPRASGRITLADVAVAAEVSPITVSRALSGRRAVDPALVERVQQVARRLGYVPDPAARALASSRGNHVVLCVPTLADPLFADAIEAAEQTLQASGHPVVLCTTRHDPRQQASRLAEQLLHRPAGVLLVPGDDGAASRALLAQAEVPCVALFALPPAVAFAAPGAPPVHAVGFSQAAAAEALTRHLIQRGRRRIAFAGAPFDAFALQRLEGWRNAMVSLGHPPDPRLEWLRHEPATPALGAALFEQIAALRPPVDAIVFSSDLLAQGALLAAARQRIPVPGRIAVAGFDDLPGSDQMTPPLTTVRAPRQRIGVEAATMLAMLIRGRVPAQPLLDVGYEIVVRRSA